MRQARYMTWITALLLGLILWSPAQVSRERAYFKRVGGVLYPLNSTWALGDATTPVAEVVATTVTVTSLSSSGNATIAKDDPAMIFDSATGSDTDFWIGITTDEDGSDDDLFQIGDGASPGTNPFLTILTSGYLGLGTPAPGSELHVYDGATNATLIIESGPENAWVYLDSNTDNGGRENSGLLLRDNSVNIWGIYKDTGNDLVIYDYTGSRPALEIIDNGHLLLAQAGGNVGIGTSSPDKNLEIESSTVVFRINDTDASPWDIENDGGALTFDYNTSEKLRVDTSGQVGIGKTPTVPLDVNGAITASGTITGGSFSSSGAANVGSVSATGTISGSSVSATGQVSGSTLSISSGGDLGNLTVQGGGDVLIGTNNGPTANGGKVLAFGDNGATDPTMGTDTAGIYAKDDSGTVELYTIDEAGNATLQTPHDRATGQWIFFSKNTKTGKCYQVNMEQLVAIVERLSGTKLAEVWYESVEEPEP